MNTNESIRQNYSDLRVKIQETSDLNFYFKTVQSKESSNTTYGYIIRENFKVFFFALSASVYDRNID